MTNDYSTIGAKISKKIKLERVNKGFSQESLALEAGLNKSTIWKIETNRISPTIDTLEKIAAALGMDFASLTDVSKVDL